MKNKAVLNLMISAMIATMALGACIVPVSAATATTTATTTRVLNVNINSIDTKVNQLMDIRGDQSIPNDTKTSEEIAAQQDILNEIIALSNNEISSVKTKLKNLPTFKKDSKEYSLQSNYLAELSSYSEYFAKESVVVSSTATLPQLQTVAANIKTFRDAGYNDEIYNMITFSLLYYDESIISTARNRLSSVLSDLTTLENAQLLSDSSVLDGKVGQATHLIGDASSLHDQVSQAILQPSLSDSTTTTASSTLSDNAPEQRSMLEKSITDIKDAYGFFIEISNNIRSQFAY